MRINKTYQGLNVNFPKFKLENKGKMLRTIIIDDEEHMRETLIDLLTDHCPEVKVIGQANSVKSGVESILDRKPDLIFLDIKMADGTGFDLLEKIEPADCKVIFVTAYDAYALKAFKFSALDYLLKPVDSVELKNAVEKARQQVQQELKTQFTILTDNLKTDDPSRKKIILKTSENIYLMRVNEIACCEGDGKYTIFYPVDGEKIITANTLKFYQDMLVESGFYRVHKSFLINLEHLKRFEKAEGGTVILQNDLRVPVASRKRHELLELFERISG